MPSQTKTPQTWANDNTYGTEAWSNLSRIAGGSDDSRASTTISYLGAQGNATQLAKGTNCGFDAMSDAARVITVKIRCERRGQARARDWRYRLVVGGVLGPIDLGGFPEGVLWFVADQIHEVSTPSGGFAELTGADVKAADFGVAVSAEIFSSDPDPDPFTALVEIDHLEIEVDFEEPPDDVEIFAALSALDVDHSAAFVERPRQAAPYMKGKRWDELTRSTAHKRSLPRPIACWASTARRRSGRSFTTFGSGRSPRRPTTPCSGSGSASRTRAPATR